MSTENTDLANPGNQKSPVDFKESKSSITGRIFAGLIVIAVGSILLAERAGAEFPFWLISWPMLLIVLGFYLGFRHTFRGPGWIIMILVGSAFLIDRIIPDLEFREYVWPIVIIGIGLAIMVRPKRKNRDLFRGNWNDRMRDQPKSTEDFLDSVTIFGGIKKNIFSKDFKGGEVVTIFGGTELNLMQADMVTPIELDITQIFGGAKLVVPPHWRIQSQDIVSIFGGVEDKRPVVAESNYDSSKILILKGTNIFGGIDIKSY
jgi:hypothetical protein